MKDEEECLQEREIEIINGNESGFFPKSLPANIGFANRPARCGASRVHGAVSEVHPPANGPEQPGVGFCVVPSRRELLEEKNVFSGREKRASS